MGLNKADYKKSINKLIGELAGHELPNSFFAAVTREDLGILERALLVGVTERKRAC